MKVKYTKPSLSVADQVKLLEARGMAIDDQAFAVRALSMAIPTGFEQSALWQ